MKKITIIIAGLIKEKYLLEGISEYQKRLRADLDFEIKELKVKKGISKKEESKLIQNNLLKYKGAKIFILAEKGEESDSIRFLKKIYSINEHIVFVISGPLGFDFTSLSDYQIISLSQMTFLHEMTALILVEQIYRAVNINKGKKYHY